MSPDGDCPLTLQCFCSHHLLLINIPLLSVEIDEIFWMRSFYYGHVLKMNTLISKVKMTPTHKNQKKLKIINLENLKFI